MKKKIRTRLLRLISAQRDMHYALEAYESFRRSIGDERYHFLLSMVVSYGRPFTENRGIGNLKVDNRTFPDYDDQKMNLRHYRLLEIRHRFLAHSSVEGTAVAVIPPGVPNPTTGEVIDRWAYNVGKREFLQPEFAAWLAEIISDLNKRLLVDINELLPLCSATEVTPLAQQAPFSWEMEGGVGQTAQSVHKASWYSRLGNWVRERFGNR